MRLLAAREGYRAATVGEIIALAGVSRPTFYAYFSDKEDCFLAALTPIQEQLLAEVHDATDGQPYQRVTASVVGALVGFASSQPTMARLLMSEPLAGGRPALDARDERIGEIAQIIDDAQQHAPPGAVTPDLSSRIILGAVCRLLAYRLRRGEHDMAGSLQELLHWIEGYARPAGEHCWRTLSLAGTPSPCPFPPPTPLRSPPPLGPGRPRIPEEAVLENHRQRIMFAAAEVIQRDGYGAATVAEITRLAGLDSRAFYRLFAGKNGVFAAVHELFFRHVMAVTAGAFITAEDWPERIWQATRAFVQCVEQNPALAYASFIAGDAAGPAAMRRGEDLVCAFAIFLQEGCRHEPKGHGRPRARPSRVALEAIVTTVFELGYQQARQRRSPQLAALLPQLAFVSLAPFLGAAETNAFLDQKTRACHEHVAPPDGQLAPGPPGRGDLLCSGAT